MMNTKQIVIVLLSSALVSVLADDRSVMIYLWSSLNDSLLLVLAFERGEAFGTTKTTMNTLNKDWLKIRT